MQLPSLVIALALAAPDAAPAEREVEATFQAIETAVQAGDAATLEKLVDPRFHMLHGLGQIEGRETWLALVRGGRLPRQSAERREYGIVVHVAGPVAVRSGIVRLRDRKAERDMWLRGSMTFVRDGASWRQLWQQSTILSDAPIAEAARLSDYAGTYDIPHRDPFRIEARDELLILRWATGAELPLVPLGADKFGSGVTSTIAFERNAAGRIVGATRSAAEGKWWTATRRP